MISIVGLNKAAVLKALFDNARSQGLGWLHFTPDPLSLEEAEELIANQGARFDYVRGRVMKVNLSGDSFSPALYDRDNGTGEAERVITLLRSK